AIAAAVGIADLQAFNKACRRELGASPRDVRAAAPAGPRRHGPGSTGRVRPRSEYDMGGQSEVRIWDR
ncbi:hypothetical protein ACFVGK_41355, partial [Streptomyces sp. NPDC057740]